MNIEVINCLILIISVIIFLIGVKLYYNFKYENIGKIIIIMGIIGVIISLLGLNVLNIVILLFR